MTRSKNRLRDLREEGRAKGKDTAHEGGNADEDIDNFTLDPEDMEASPSHPQKGSMQVSDQQFGSWLRANTPNLAKKTVIYVAGCEEVIHGDDGLALHSEQSEGENVETVNSMQSNGISMHHCGVNMEGGSANSKMVHGQEEEPIATDGDGSLVLDEIHVELERFDGEKELGQQNRVCRGIGVGGRIEKLVGGVTNYALQSDVGSTPSIIPGELGSLK
nr:hypothetical protein CFP56_44840 [Quercus suber]